MRYLLTTLSLASAATLTALSAVENPEAPRQDPAVKDMADGHDPLAGMDADGRIPKTVLPEDIKQPDRWRYVPAGRIPDGHLFKRFFVTSFIVPQITYEEDIGLELGVALADLDFRHQRRQELVAVRASRSTEGQEFYRFVWQRQLAHRELPDGAIAFEERSQVRVSAGYKKPLTARFFGIGADTEDSDETSYTDEATEVQVGIIHGLPQADGDFVAGLAIRYEHHNIRDGKLSDRPSTIDQFPELAELGDDYDALWLQAQLRYDCRDSEHQPYRGGTIGLSLDIVPLQTKQDAGLVSTLDASAAFPIPSPFHSGGEGDEENPPTDTIAIGGFVQATAGDVPFYHLPSLGGNKSLRGFIRGRFRDRAAWHLSAEWRTWPIPRGYAFTDSIRIERFGLALFYDIGSVASRLGNLPDATIHDNYGLGLRLAFERTAVFRMDYALSDEDRQFIAAFGLSF